MVRGEPRAALSPFFSVIYLRHEERVSQGTRNVCTNVQVYVHLTVRRMYLYVVTCSFARLRAAYALQSPADVGVIEKLVLEDFMCHRRLEVSFSPNVNFVVGQSGSK